jgi:hypothetical protein
MISLSKTSQGNYLPFCGDSSNDVFTIILIIGQSSEKNWKKACDTANYLNKKSLNL